MLKPLATKKKLFERLDKKKVSISTVIILIAILIFAGIRIFALDENSWTVGGGMNTELITGSSEGVVITSSNVTLDKDLNWLGLDWDYKKELTIKNIEEAVLPLGDTVSVTVDTSGLEAIQDDCDDLRVGYITPSNTLREIPRSIALSQGATGCLDSDGTKVTFNLEKELTYSSLEGYVAGDELDTNYVMFYGSTGVEAPSFPTEKYLNFDGVDDIVDLGTGIPFTSGPDTLYTASFWVKVDDDFDYAHYKGVLGSLSSAWNVLYFLDSTQMRLCHAGGIGGCNAWVISSVDDGQWHHFTLKVDSANSYLELYQDGLSVGEKTSPNYSTIPIKHIGRQSSINNSFKGAIDDVFFYNSLLSEADIKSLYNGNIPEADMYLGYDFNEGTGQLLSDVSGNSRDEYLGSTDQVEDTDPIRIDSGTTIYDIDGIPSTLSCPLNGNMECANGQGTTYEAGAIGSDAGGSALEFDGFNDYVRIPDALGYSTQVSAFAWFQSEGISVSGSHIVLGGEQLEITVSQSGSLRTGVQTSSGRFQSSSGSGLTDGNWHHVGFTFDGVTKKTYIDGAFSGEQTAIEGALVNDFNRAIGRFGASTTYLLNGYLDEIAIYNREISLSEVQNIYNNPLVEPDSSTVALYHFDENGIDARFSTIETDLETTLGVTGNGIVYDSSGNGNHGLIVGATYTNHTPIPTSSTASHEGLFFEEPTLNKILNPGFEHSTAFDNGWGSNYFNLNVASSTFTPKMATRDSDGPFGGGPIVQEDSTGTYGDFLANIIGNLIDTGFYERFDRNQGSIALWVTPEWDGDDGRIHHFVDWYGSSAALSKDANSTLNLYIHSGALVSVDVSSWVAGETHSIVARWDTKNKIDGTNYLCLTVDDVTTCGSTVAPLIAGYTNFVVGGRTGLDGQKANAIIEGLTVYRRVLYDGTYGTDIGNGDELAQIYNAGTGKDPTLITGSWDVTFALPTDATPGVLASTGQAWSMPHSSNLLAGLNGKNGFMMDGTYTNDGFSSFSPNKLLNTGLNSNLDNWDYIQDYDLRDEFSDTVAAGSVNGTLATDGSSTRTVTDTLNKLNLQDGKVNFITGGVNAGDPGIRYPSNNRTLGKVLFGKITQEGGYTTLGWDDNITGRIEEGALFYADRIYHFSPGIESPIVAMTTSGIEYDVAILIRSSGSYLFINGGEYADWTLLGISHSGAGSVLYPGLAVYTSTISALAGDSLRIPTSTWLPTPLAYDTFTRSDGAIGSSETTGPDSQTTPSLSWNGGEISGNELKITPELGTEMWDADASVFTSGTYGWVAYGSNTIANVSNALELTYIDRADGGYDYFNGLTIGTWYQYANDIKVNTGSIDMRLYSFPTTEPSIPVTETTLTTKSRTFLGKHASNNYLNFVGLSTGEVITLDNQSLKPLTLSSLFSAISTSDTDVIVDADVTLTSGTQAGLVTNLDSTSSPSNFLIAYHDGANIHLEKSVNGVYTSLINTVVTYVPGATLRVTTDSSSGDLKVRVYYNDVFIGTEQTISDPEIIDNTIHGLFSTYEGNTFDNFSLFARGTGGEYNSIPAQDLTATISHSAKYSGEASVKLGAGGNDANFTQSNNVGNTDAHTLTAYAYTDGTAITTADLELWYDTATISTTYTDMGSGWYKLTGSITGEASSKEFGVRVKADKTVYVDDIELLIDTDNTTVTVLGLVEQIFSGGYSVSSDPSGGIYKDITVTAGQDLVIRSLAHSDGTSIPKLVLYDQTNNKEIGSLEGTTTSTVDNPDNILFTGEAPSSFFATGTIQLTALPSVDDIVEIGGILYTFKSDISAPGVAEIYILIGADITETATNLVNAINGGVGVGSTYSYGTGSVAHTEVSSTSDVAVITVTSLTDGFSGNTITLGKIGTNITISGDSLEGGLSDTTTIRIKLLNSSSTTSTVNWHQVEVYNNLVDNPSMEGGTGDPWIPDGWGNFGVPVGGSSEGLEARTGNTSFGLETSISGYIRKDHSVSTQFYGLGAAGYGDGTASASFGPGSGGTNWLQHNTAEYFSSLIIDPAVSWKYKHAVGNTGTSDTAYMLLYPSGTAVDKRYVDDIYILPLDDVSLTVTPMTLEESTNVDGGVEVNGEDTFVQNYTGVDGSDFSMKFKFVPRFDTSVAEIINKDSIGTNRQYLFFTQFSNGYIALFDNYLHVTMGTSGGTSPFSFVGDQEYLIEIKYKYPGNVVLLIDGIEVYSQPTTQAATGDPSVRWGYLDSRRYDGTLYPYPATTSTVNTSKNFIKDGTNSVKLEASTAPDSYFTNLNVGNINSHTLSAYVYDSTTGNIGGEVDNTIASLIFNDETITTTYTDMGGGFWRLTYTDVGVDALGDYGIRLEADKTIHVDNFQLEEKTYPTTYTDGSLGNGYTWSGVANESTSDRGGARIAYDTNLETPINGAYSFWFKHITDNAHTGILLKNASNQHTSVSVDPSGAVYMKIQADSAEVFYNYCPATAANGSWNHVVGNWDSETYEITCCLNGACSTPSPTAVDSYTDYNSFYLGGHADTYSPLHANSSISDVRFFEDTLTQEQTTQLYNQRLTTQQTSSSVDEKYASEGTWTSQTIDLGNNGQWGTSPALSIVENLNGNGITYKTRTSPDQNTWTAWEEIVSSGANYDFLSAPNRYMEIMATLTSTNQLTTPEFVSMAFNYVEDTIAPITNASNIQYYTASSGGELVTQDTWTNVDQPYITWDAGLDNIDGSGLRGYCLYLGTDINGDPATSGGLLSTTSPIYTADTNCQFIIDTNSIDLSNVTFHGDPWITSSNDTYYFKIKAVDLTGNVYSPDSEVFSYKFDNTIPTNPKGLSAPQEYQREIESFRIFWPETGVSAATDAHSGVQGYQYRIGEAGTWYGTGHTGTEDCTDLITVYDYTLQLQFAGETFGDELEIGENVLYIRTYDNICNVTDTYATAILQYSADAPSSPKNLQVTPVVNTSNEFAFTWELPEVYSGQESGLTYGYTVNSLPSANRSIWTSGLSLGTDAYANQPGVNVLYLIAKDEAGNVNYDDYTLIVFEANTSAPGFVSNIEISDFSIKAEESWRLAIVWSEPEEVGTGISNYQVFRSEEQGAIYSEDNSTFIYIGTTAGESYTDTNLLQTEYAYVVKACDSANNCSATSATISMLPTGRFYVPAGILINPIISNLSTRSATISWVTDRESDSKIQYGLSSGEYFKDEVYQSEQVVNHLIKLNNLSAGTGYFFKSKWTDIDGNTGITDELLFKTKPAPTVKDVEVVYVNLDSATIRFTTTDASKVRLYYGDTTSLDSFSDLETSQLETKYSLTLSDLNDGVEYSYKINLFDLDANEYDGSVILNFTTPPKPEISVIQIEESYGTPEPSMIVTWQTNTDLNSVIRYYPSDRIDLLQNKVDIELIDGEHEIALTGLLPETTYTYEIQGTDKLGNTVVSEQYTFTTSTDTRPPKIYDIVITKSSISRDIQPDRNKSSQLIVSWKTDEPSTSKIIFGDGLNNSYARSTKLESSLKTQHAIVITNLIPSKVYHLKAVSVDSADNKSESEKNIAITLKASDSLLEIISGSLSRIFRYIR